MNFDNIQRTLGRIESSIDSIKEMVEGTAESHEKLERRVRGVESLQHWYSGAAAVIGSIAGIIFGRHS